MGSAIFYLPERQFGSTMFYLRLILGSVLLSLVPAMPAIASQPTKLECNGRETSFFVGEKFAGENEDEYMIICEYVGDDFSYRRTSKFDGKVSEFPLKRRNSSVFVGKNGKYTYTINITTRTLYIRQGRKLKQIKKILITTN